ncbi:MAG: cysteine desulfurase family protein [Candidatus Pacearchaeota archaeon]
MIMKRVYLDYAATTPLDQEVLKAMQPWFSKKFGNPGSLHSFGQEAKQAIDDAREKIARLINANSHEIIFTSSGTEANNLAIKGFALANKQKGKHILISTIEHKAVINPAKWLKEQGFEVEFVNVDSEGIVKLDELEQKIRKDTILISVMTVNNEIGTIQPIDEIAKICNAKGICFHTDAVQAIGKMHFDVKELNIGMLSASGHKIYGPKGTALLYKRADIRLMPLLHGGGQENGLRSSTENVPGIVGIAKAIELCLKNLDKEGERQAKLRDKIIDEVLDYDFIKVRLNGSREKRIFNNANFSFYGIEGEALVLMLNEKGIATSTGSACSEKTLEPSHVLLALGLKPQEAHGSLRVTLGRYTTKRDTDYFLEVLPEAIKKLKKISPFK